jgi:hypothetical protein
MPEAGPAPLSRLDYRIETGCVLLDDGRTYPATTLEEELFALVLEARWLIVNADEPTGFAALEPNVGDWKRRRTSFLEAVAGVRGSEVPR